MEAGIPAPAMASLEALVGDGRPNPIGSAENRRHLEFILSALKSYSYYPEVQDEYVCSQIGACGRVRNAIAVKEGKNREEIVLVAAHYDSVGAGPGAWDNSAGVAAVLEVARILATVEELPRTVMFFFDDGEEAGLLGAEAFARFHPRMSAVRVLLNVDGMAGLSALRLQGPDRYFLANILGPALDYPYLSSSFDHLESLRGGFDDSQVFLSRGISTAGIQGYGGGKIYHTPNDDFASLDPAAIHHKAQTALAATLALARADLSGLGKKERGAFFDVGALFVVSASQLWWIALGVLGGVAWIFRARSWVWTPLAFAGLATSIFAVEMSYLLVLPALAAALSPRTPILGSLLGAMLIAAPARVAYETKNGGEGIANVRFEHDATKLQSRLIVTGDLIFAGAEKMAKPYPWSSGGTPGWVSSSTVAEGPPPKFEIGSEMLIDGKRTIRGRLSSPRGALQLSVALDAKIEVGEMLVAGVAVTRVSNGYRLFTLYGLEEGVDFELRGLTPTPVEMVLTDISLGLPAAALGAARPTKRWVPRDMGDSTAVVVRVRL
jgi:hypothetical protein